MKPTRSNLRLLTFGGIFLTASFAHAANTDGTWNADADGNWNDAGNWSSSSIADGIGFTAFFTQELTADRIVTLGADRTIGNITFTDGTTSDSNLTISGANLLTLDVASGAPVINVTQADRTLTIATAVAGLDGLSKTGAGTLSLTGLSSTASSNYSGTTTLDGGTLALGSATTAALGGGLTFGATAGSTNVSTLDLTSANASFAGPLTVQTNSASANLVTIGSGKTLTLTGAVTVGYPVASTTTKLTMTGGGSLNVNAPATTFQIGAASASSTLDVSALASFTASVTTFSLGSVLVDAQAGSGTLFLSDTANDITATTLRVGAPFSNGSGAGLLRLGAGTNVIKADSINLGTYKGSSGTITFASQTAGSPGTVTISNKAGTGGASITIGARGVTTSSGGITGVLDLRGHTANVTASDLIIGNGENNKTGSATGTLSFDAGTFTVNNITLGKKENGGVNTSTGNINIGGGAFTVNSGGSFTMATNTYPTAGAAIGNLNVTGGVFTSNVNITKGGGLNTTANITLNGGTIDMAGTNIGDATNPINLTLSSGTLKNVGQINGGGAVTKGSAGTLTLDGTNTFTGATTVNAGLLTLGNSLALQNSTLDTAASIASGSATTGLKTTVTTLTLGGLSGDKNLASLFDSTNGYGGVTALTLNPGTGASPSYSGGIADGATGMTLSKTGDGTQTLSGDNSYTGGTTTSAGTLTLSHTNAAGTGAISLTGATSVLKIGAGISLGNIANDITISNAGASVVRTVAASVAYSLGTGIDLKSSFAGGQPDTIANILGGTNTGAEENLTLGFSGTSAAGNDGIRRSDVFTIANSGSFDEFVLQLVVSGSASDTKLGWLNGSNQWVNAGGTFYSQTYDFAARSLGDYGFDVSTGSAWAVVNTGGSYALIPEPTSALAGLLLGAGLLRRRRK